VSGPTICLLGDVMLGRRVAEAVLGMPAPEVWSSGVRNACADCDVLVLNLECCVSERGAPTRLIPRKPFFFRAPPKAVDALRAIGTTVAGLANNHALDFGDEALVDTLAHLRDGGVTPIGAGATLEEAQSGVVTHAGPLRLGVLALSDHPSAYAADRSRPGIAHAELHRALPEWVTAELQRLRDQADVVLAFLHWGPNMTTGPARWQRDRSRELLAEGADAVAGHSAHVFHGVELTSSGPVMYDLGGALDDYAIDEELRNDLGVLARWRPRGEPEVELVGLRLDFCRTELAAGADADWIAERLERACDKFGTSVRRVDEGRFALLRRPTGST
jgi:poly-gamma-glutamate capsule biosynthesis protein CapA/YwtB (metallophosphatase superfamily)